MLSVLSASGGMDSTSLLMRLLGEGHEVHAISFYYGQTHSLELIRLKDNITYLSENGYKVVHKVINIKSIMSSFHSALTGLIDMPEGHYEEDNMKDTVVPNRNAIFSSIIYGYALSEANKRGCKAQVALGVHSGDHAIYPDCRPEFYDYLFMAFDFGNWNSESVKLYLPYLNGDKESILVDAIHYCKKLRLDFDTVFANTNTGYDPDEKGRSSGKTGADIERILAFHAIGRTDPIEYVDGWESALKHAISTQERHDTDKEQHSNSES